jgi:glycosyltransferase involved in cell wall biosynthesis
MKRIAVIFESSPFDRKGLFNAVHNRVRNLLASGECWVDVYCIHSSDNALTRQLRHTVFAPKVDSVELDGVTYRMLWYKFSILDHITLEKFGKRPFCFRQFIKRNVSYLEGYDLVIAHSFTGGLFAYEAYNRFAVPYFANWHGSDVHTHPWRVPVILEDTRRVMEKAKCNFFVSTALKTASDKITVNARKDVLYNGVAEEFTGLDTFERAQAREHFGLPSDARIVAFAGNLSPVKNVMSLPEIFKSVSALYEGKLYFVVAGDGKLRKPLETAFHSHYERSEESFTFLGNIPSEDMPALMNCIDVLVLPSINEGLPLVCAEALRCGANVVGSDVGGIAEVIGHENVVPLGEGFERQMAEKVVEMLASRDSEEGYSQPLPTEISWSRTTLLELESFRQIGSEA